MSKLTIWGQASQEDASLEGRPRGLLLRDARPGGLRFGVAESRSEPPTPERT